MDTTIKLILQEIVRRIWIVILCAIVGYTGAYVYTKVNIPPVYTTQMKVSALTNLADDEAVSSVGSFINMMTLAERRVQAYLEHFCTSGFYKMVAETSQTGYTAGAVGSMLEFEQVEGMGLFYVRVTGTDPVAVKAVADAVADTMYPFMEQYQSRSAVAVIEPAYMPSVPINQQLTGNCTKGALIFAMLAVVIIALIAFFDTHIKDEETLAKRYADIPILGKIPDFSNITDKKKR